MPYREQNSRGICWNFSRYFELDGIGFFIVGLELRKRMSLAKSQRNKRGSAKTVRTPASFGQSLYESVVFVTP